MYCSVKRSYRFSAYGAYCHCKTVSLESPLKVCERGKLIVQAFHDSEFEHVLYVSMCFMARITTLVLRARSQNFVMLVLVRRVHVVFSTAGFKEEGLVLRPVKPLHLYIADLNGLRIHVWMKDMRTALYQTIAI